MNQLESKPRLSLCFEVEKVIGVSSDGNYQVQWAPAWVNKFHLVGCEHLIEEYLQQQQVKSLVNETTHTDMHSSDVELSTVSNEPCDGGLYNDNSTIDALGLEENIDPDEHNVELDVCIKIEEEDVAMDVPEYLEYPRQQQQQLLQQQEQQQQQQQLQQQQQHQQQQQQQHQQEQQQQQQQQRQQHQQQQQQQQQQHRRQQQQRQQQQQQQQ